TDRAAPDAPFDSIIVPQNSSLQTLADIQGKKVGVFPGSTGTNVLKYTMRKKGLDPSQTTFLQLTGANQLSALESGSIDALFAYEPTFTIAMQKLHTRVI